MLIIKFRRKKNRIWKKLQKRGSLFIDCRKREKKRFVVVDDIHDQFSRKLTPFWRNPLHINKRGSAIEWRSFVIDRDPIDGYCFTVSNHARIFRNFSNSIRRVVEYATKPSMMKSIWNWQRNVYIIRDNFSKLFSIIFSEFLTDDMRPCFVSETSLTKFNNSNLRIARTCIR